MASDNPITRKTAGYDPEIALRICELVASGKVISEFEGTDDLPSKSTIYRWLATFPKFYDAYQRAVEVSAQSMEEEAIMLARKLTGPNDFTGTKVQAYNVAMQQLRWSASRRDKTRYGQQQTGAQVVPIQINTTLNLGQDGAPAVDAGSQSQDFSISFEVPIAPAVVEGPDPDIELSDLRGEIIDLSAEDPDNDQLPYGVPVNEKQQLYNPPPGRPPRRKKGHKTPGRTAMTAKRYAAKKDTD